MFLGKLGATPVRLALVLIPHLQIRPISPAGGVLGASTFTASSYRSVYQSPVPPIPRQSLLPYPQDPDLVLPY